MNDEDTPILSMAQHQSIYTTTSKYNPQEETTAKLLRLSLKPMLSKSLPHSFISNIYTLPILYLHLYIVQFLTAFMLYFVYPGLFLYWTADGKLLGWILVSFMVFNMFGRLASGFIKIYKLVHLELIQVSSIRSSSLLYSYIFICLSIGYPLMGNTRYSGTYKSSSFLLSVSFQWVLSAI